MLGASGRSHVAKSTRDVEASRHTPSEFSRHLFEPLPSRYNFLAALLSLGQDRRWRRTMIDHVVGAEPRLTLDVACGPCAVTKSLAKRTSSRIIGLDLSADMLGEGAKNIAAAKLDGRVALVLGRGEKLPFPDNTFDALTFTYLLRYVSDPRATMEELARVVKPNGPLASLEFAVPPQRFWRAAWWLYTRAVLPVAGYVTGGRGWWDVGRFLGPSISRHYREYPVDWTVAAWQRAGMDHVEYKRMSLGGGLVMWGYRASS
jgi:demethylmenaquinone methyltransferase / 2-methoxy-6-polyprenyl-1,4-benzoquinol methylase